MPARRRTLRGAVRLLGAVTGLAGLIVVVVGLPAAWARWEARGRVLTLEQAPVRDVAIVFGAEAYPDGRPSRYLRARLDLAAALYQAGKARVVIVSGDDSAAHHHEATAMRDYLVARGVPSSRVVPDAHGLDTYDTCVRARDVFGVRRALLVSQRYHLTRAVATCRALGVDAVGVGDVTVKRTSRRWNEFAAREYGANLKMVADLLTRRVPVLGPPSDAVATALAS